MRVLQIGSDRSKRGILYPDTPAAERQVAYAKELGNLDIIALSRKSDQAVPYEIETLRVYPTDSPSILHYAPDAWHIFRNLSRPDVISVQDPFEVGLLGYLFSRIARVPLHVQVHTDFLAPAFGRHSLQNRIRVLLAGFVLRGASRIRVVSERIQYGIEQRYKITTPISVLPIYVDIRAIREAPAGAALSARFARFPRKLAFIGRLEPEKHPCLALRAFAAGASAGSC